MNTITLQNIALMLENPPAPQAQDCVEASDSAKAYARYLLNHGAAMGSTLRKHCQPNDMPPSSALKPYLRRGLIAFEKTHGQPGLNGVYQVCPGVQAADFGLER